MKILKKVFISLFSLVLFCGISVTVHAASPRVSATAYVQDDNASIVLEMKSKDGKKHNYSMYATYYNKKGKSIKQEKSVDEYEYRTMEKKLSGEM